MNLKIYNYDSVFKELMLQPEGCNGEYRDRTDDPLLAKQVLSQLSYTPVVIALGCLFSCFNRPQKLNNDFNLGPNGFHRSDLGC